jgi:hypothetical protein
MRAKYVGNKADKIIFNIKNVEAVSTVPLGAPVVFNLSVTSSADDGLGVVLPSTAGALKYNLLAGVNLSYQLAVNQMGEAILFGYSPKTLVKVNTRAASTDTWASVASVASGVLLTPDFTHNAWQTLANVAAESRPNLILLDDIATVASAASTAGGSALVSTRMHRAFATML